MAEYDSELHDSLNGVLSECRREDFSQGRIVQTIIKWHVAQLERTPLSLLDDLAFGDVKGAIAFARANGWAPAPTRWCEDIRWEQKPYAKRFAWVLNEIDADKREVPDKWLYCPLCAAPRPKETT